LDEKSPVSEFLAVLDFLRQTFETFSKEHLCLGC
jgi:hypothetical protein